MRFLRKSGSKKTKLSLDHIPPTDLEGLKFSSDLDTNVRLLRQLFQECHDVVFRSFELGNEGSIGGLLIFVDGLVDKNQVNRDILSPLMLENMNFPGDHDEFARKKIEDSLLTLGELKERYQVKDFINDILSGNAGFLFEGNECGFSLGVRGWEGRSPEQPDTETVVRGPKEGFVETFRINTSLLRRKIKSSKFKIEIKQIGRHTKTDVAVAYIEGIADPDIVREVHHRLDKIDIDGVLESGYLEDYIQDNPYSPFPQVTTTERPDKVAANLLEGRVAIITGGSPIVMTVPTVVMELLQASEDYYDRYIMSSFIRLSRFFGLNVALLLPSMYIALTTFHQEMLPTPLLIGIASQREGVPFPALVEALIMELAFEMIREAALRMPRSIGQTVSIVGALIIGDAAVTAGLVSALMVIVVGITAIASFSMPSWSIANALRLLRFPLMLLAGGLGLFGVVVGLLAILIHLCSLRSFGVPYLSPIAPFNKSDMKDVIFRVPWWMMLKRPGSMRTEDVFRQPAGQKPRPPGKGDQND